MNIFDMIFGAVVGLFGLFALVAGVFRSGNTSFPLRLLALCFGVAFVTFGIVHFSEGVGASWATPRLRRSLYFWFAIPCLAALLFAWFTERYRKNRGKRDLL